MNVAAEASTAPMNAVTDGSCSVSLISLTAVYLYLFMSLMMFYHILSHF